jgi:hypothetical protein
VDHAERVIVVRHRWNPGRLGVLDIVGRKSTRTRRVMWSVRAESLAEGIDETQAVALNYRQQEVDSDSTTCGSESWAHRSMELARSVFLETVGKKSAPDSTDFLPKTQRAGR